MSEIPVLVSDLELLRGLLATLFNQHDAVDLVEQYRRLDNRPRRSALTNAIADGLSKVEAYIETTAEEPEDDD